MAKNQQSKRFLSFFHVIFLNNFFSQLFFKLHFLYFLIVTEEDLRRIEKDRRELNAAYDNVRVYLLNDIKQKKYLIDD